MSYLTRSQYTELGHNAVPETEFMRWEIHAELIVKDYTNGSMSDADVTETNRRGVCEIMDALYTADKALLGSEGGQPVTGYKNDDYSESYANPKDLQALVSNAVEGFLRVYFTRGSKKNWAWA